MKLNKQMRFFFALLHVSVSEVLSVIMKAVDATVCVSVSITDLAQIWETTWYCGWMMRLNMNSTAVTEDTVGSMWVRQCLVKCVFFFFLVCKTIDCLICASKISLYCSYGDISCHV